MAILIGVMLTIIALLCVAVMAIIGMLLDIQETVRDIADCMDLPDDDDPKEEDEPEENKVIELPRLRRVA